MGKIVNYKDKYYKEFNTLYKRHDECIKSSVFENFRIGTDRGIKLFKASGQLRGYIVFTKPHLIQKHDKLIVHRMFLEENYDDLTNYKKLIKSINKFLIFRRAEYAQVFMSEKDGISEMAKVLDMKLENRIIQMKAVLTKNMELSQENGISFDFFSKGWDEAKRVEVQNGIFRGTKNHVDCCINDILMEGNQRYFIEDGCIFIKTAGKTIGYSQIILESGEKPYIVNFGIIKNYRGQGFAKALLSYTLNSIRAKGFDEVFITVDAENYIALNLYKSMGFFKTNAFSSFLYKFP